MIYTLQIAGRPAQEIDATDEHDAYRKACAICREGCAELPGDTFVSVTDEAGGRWGATLSHYM